jgi:tRNA(fMet)-specific endonuclease VapC
VKYLLDTDICIFWLRGHEPVRHSLAAVGPEATAISVITLAELRYGAECSAQPEVNHRAVDDFINAVVTLDVDGGVAHRFGDFKAQLRRRGMLIEDFDLLIAATACNYRLTLVTNNTDHFSRIPELEVENWVQK